MITKNYCTSYMNFWNMKVTAEHQYGQKKQKLYVNIMFQKYKRGIVQQKNNKT